MTSEDLSGTHRKSALQLDVEVLERRVVELERRLSEMAIEVVALTEENRVLKLRLKEEERWIERYFLGEKLTR